MNALDTMLDPLAVRDEVCRRRQVQEVVEGANSTQSASIQSPPWCASRKARMKSERWATCQAAMSISRSRSHSSPNERGSSKTARGAWRKMVRQQASIHSG